MKLNPRATRKQLAADLGVSEQTIRYCLEKLQKEGVLTRKGATKNGEWIVNSGD